MRLHVLPSAIGLLVLLTGCSAPPERIRSEDQSRKVAPVPACVLPLPARRAASAGTQRKLTESQVVKLMFPGFDESKLALPERAPSCTGAPVLDSPLFRDGKLARGGWPFVAREGDVTYGSGGDGLKLVWVRTHVFGDESAAGPIAVIRSGERFAELFAIGQYRGVPERTTLTTVRMGGEYLVTARDDGCTARKPGLPCRTVMTVLLPRMGRLVPVVEVPLERVAYGGRVERGASGVLEYRMASVPEFKDGAIRIVEQVRVIDDTGRDLRKAEHERTVSFDDTGASRASQPSLWDEMVAPEVSASRRPGHP